MKPEEFAALATNLATEFTDHIDYFSIENDENAGTTRLEVNFREKPKPVLTTDHVFHTSRGGIL